MQKMGLNKPGYCHWGLSASDGEWLVLLWDWNFAALKLKKKGKKKQQRKDRDQNRNNFTMIFPDVFFLRREPFDSEKARVA